MSYEKQTWITGETITADKLNHMEDGINNGFFIFDFTNAFINDYDLDGNVVNALHASHAPMMCETIDDQDAIYILSQHTPISCVYTRNASFGVVLYMIDLNDSILYITNGENIRYSYDQETGNYIFQSEPV